MKKKDLMETSEDYDVRNEPCYLCPDIAECIGKGFCINMEYDYTKGDQL